jgi:hypothetical protein
MPSVVFRNETAEEGKSLGVSTEIPIYISTDIASRPATRLVIVSPSVSLSRLNLHRTCLTESDQLKYAPKRTNGLKLAIVAVPLFVGLAAWQFYLFVTFKDSTGSLEAHGGYGHLVIAVLVTLLAAITGFFIFSVFLQRDREDELHITSRH